ncbi:transposon Tf2-6 polyprotein [Trichonephila clavipes]|nr:transposon Tf2-6 polyprotein [Trichonephila clavipes]
MFLADTLSRAFPVSETVRDDPEMLNIVHTISKHLPMSEKRRVQFKKETELDPELQIAVKYIKESWPKSYKNVDNSIGVDIMDLGNTSYLVVIDYYSKWIEIAELVNKSADEVIIKLSIFSRFSVPNIVVSDNISFNSYIYKKFANDWDFKYVFISPHYFPSNGMVEKAVGISKSIMKKAREDRRYYLVGLMEYRNTPISGLDLSPAQMMINRRLKTKLPISNKLLNAELFNNIREKLIKRQNVQKIHYDKTAHPLPELEPEDVRILNFKNKNLGTG